MRFVHLTDPRNVPAIRRNGLRLGRDLLGRGVCCVPLMMLKVLSARSPNDVDDAVELANLRPVSSSCIWRGFGASAVVFQPSASLWPADVYLWVPESAAAQLHRRMRTCTAVRWGESDEAATGKERHVALHVDGPRGMGFLMRHFLELRPPLARFGDKAIEVVFRQGIPASCIKRVVAVQTPKQRSRGAERRSAIREQMS